MSAVKLDKRIYFVATIISSDSEGFQTEVEEVYYSCWANVKRLSFKEFYENSTSVSKTVDSFRVRKCKIVELMNSKQYKIRYNDKLYNIIYINPDSEEGYIDFKGEVVE